MIRTLDDEEARNVARCGGKAATLAKLRAEGLPVPEGFVVTTDAFAAALRALDLDAPVRALLEQDASVDELERAAQGLSEKLRGAALPASLVAQIAEHAARFGDGQRWAVRSSAIAEDLADASFAGQYESVLGVRGVPELSAALLRCWSSFLNARSLHYRRTRGIREAGGAVLLQRMVDADAAGVAFTLDPMSGATDRVLINASFGLGESVVGGLVTPDQFAVVKATRAIAQRRIGDKRVRTVPVDGGTRSEELPEAMRAQPSLADVAIGEVADLALRIEALRGHPVDIEWCVADGRVHLLQSRAVTAVRRADAGPPDDWVPELNTRIDPRYPLYSNGNVSEVMPGCVTPLTWSLVGPSLERAFRTLPEAVGSMKDVGPDPVVTGFFYHRVYLNLTYFFEAADRSPGTSRETALEELVGHTDPGKWASPKPGWKAWLPWRALPAFGVLGRALALQGQLPKDVERARAICLEKQRLVEENDPARQPLAELVAAPDEDTIWPGLIHIRASQFAVSGFEMLRKLTKKWLGDETGALAATLVTGIALSSGEPAFALHALSRVVAADPDLMAKFEREPDDRALLASIMADPSPSAERFRGELRAFLDRHGHRGLGEIELRNPCWREAPAEVIAHVRNHLRPGTTPPEEIQARQRAASEAARAQAMARLGSLRRSWLGRVLDSVRANIAAREEMKDSIIRLSYVARRRLGAARERLVADGILARRDDLYFLLREELERIARGELGAPEVPAIVARRRRDFAWAESVAVPRLQEETPRFLRQAPPAPASGAITGMGVSPGRATGPARVILDPRATAALLPGEILVAPVTDLAWTPLFLNAAAVVVEVGGMLSHGSVVAREYGIPAVVAAAGATTAFRTGDVLTVDADRGTVSRAG
jgi:pyruvate,water dikinase